MKLILRSTLYVVVLTVLLGGAYPAAVTGVSRIFWKEKADGSFVTAGGRVVGSELIGQNFKEPALPPPSPFRRRQGRLRRDRFAGNEQGTDRRGSREGDRGGRRRGARGPTGRERSRSRGPGDHLGVRLRSASLPRRRPLAGGTHREGARRLRGESRRDHPPPRRAADAGALRRAARQRAPDQPRPRPDARGRARRIRPCRRRRPGAAPRTSSCGFSRSPAAASSRSTSATPRASARPTRCSRTPMR